MSPSRLLLALVSLLPVLHLAGCSQSEADALAKARTKLESADPNATRIELKSLIQAHPKSGEARLLLGLRLLDDGDSAGAVSELQRAIEFGAAESKALPPLAEALLLGGRFAQVTQTYASTRLPDSAAQARLQAAVAQAELAQGQTDAARNALARALAAASNSPQALLVKARRKASRLNCCWFRKGPGL